MRISDWSSDVCSSDLFNDLRQRYDFIVLNAPATLAVRDARAISEIADTTLMVVDWGKTTVDQARAALEILEYNVAGVAFNKVDYAEHARRGNRDEAIGRASGRERVYQYV